MSEYRVSKTDDSSTKMAKLIGALCLCPCYSNTLLILINNLTEFSFQCSREVAH